MEPEEVNESIGDPQDIEEQFRWAVDYWGPRNEFIKTARDTIDGKNLIKLPENVQYTARALHTYLLAGIINEKASRYMHLPTPQIIVDDPLEDESRANSTKLERALDVISYEMERRGDGDVWSRAMWDAILLDGGCELLERAPAAFWKELVIDNKDGSKKYPLESATRDNYKKEMGAPLRSLYVPLESVFPIYDGSTPEMVFHTEYRTLWSCKRNSLFDQSVLDDFNSDDPTKGLNTEVTIVRYADPLYYAYYAVFPSSAGTTVPRRKPGDDVNTLGELKFLYGHKHNLGRVPYNFIAGRYGGWKTDTNRIESTGRAMIELNQAADEIVSQVFTNIRAKYWPNLKWIIDPELRGTNSGSTPEAPIISEGENIALYKGEDLLPIFLPQNDPSVPWLIDQIREQLGNLGGSAVLFGKREPGVDVGYLHAQQVSQAEHLDEKQEQHAQQGGINHYTLMLLHIREIGEPVWTHYSETNQKRNGRVGEYIKIDPKSLFPLPRVDVRVRKPRPIDFMTSIRAAREASDEREGKGPLYSDDTIREIILGVEYPDLEDKKVRLQTVKKAILNTNMITNKVGEMINIKLARTGVPEISPEMMGQIDPALLASLQEQVASGQVPPGGISPDILQSLMGGNGAGPPAQQNPLNRSGGMLPNDPQMEANIGTMIAGNQRGMI